MKKRFLVPLVLSGCVAACIGSAAVTNSIINVSASVSGPVSQEDVIAQAGNELPEDKGAGEKQINKDRESVVKSASADRDALKTVQDTEKVKGLPEEEVSEGVPDQGAVQGSDQKVYTQEVSVTEYTVSNKGTDSYVGSVAAVSGERSVNREDVTKTDTSEKRKADTVDEVEQNIKEEPEQEKKTVVAEIAAVAAASAEEEASVRDNTVSYAKKSTTGSDSGYYDSGDGWETSTEIGTETTRCICVTYPKKVVRLIKHTFYYQTGDFKIVECYKNGKIIDEDDYKDEYEDALEDMRDGECTMELSSSQSPILVQKIVK